MKEHGLGLFSLQSLVLLAQALLRLEVGQVALASIKDRMHLLHSF